MDVTRFRNFFRTKFPHIMMETKEAPLGENYEDPTRVPLEMEKLDVRLSIHQNVVRATYLMTFYNNLDRKLTGDLCFPLPPDGTIHGYGLDVNGVIIDAVPVEKKKSRVAFETEVREQHDDGSSVSVAEKVEAGSNIWKLKVYPIPPNGRRIVKIVVHYPSIIIIIDDDDDDDKKEEEEEEEEQTVAVLGLSKPESLKEFSFSCSNNKSKVFIKLSSSSEQKQVKPEDISVNDDIEGIIVVVPKELKNNNNNNIQIYIEKDPDSSYHYFSLNHSSIIDDDKNNNKEKYVNNNNNNNKLLSIYYDISSSRSSCDQEKEMKLIENYMKYYNKECEEIEVTTFSCYLHDIKKRFKKENLQSFFEYIKSQHFDGGTSLLPISQILFEQSKSNPMFLFSDGMNNFGMDINYILDQKSKKKNLISSPIFCISSTRNANYVFLRYISEVLSNGGVFIDLFSPLNTNIITSDQYNNIFSRKNQVTLKNIVCEPLSSVDEIYQHHHQQQRQSLSSSTTHHNNNNYTIYGRILEPEKEPVIQLEFSNGKIVETKISLDLYNNCNEEEKSTLIRTLWAQKRIDKLSLFSSNNNNKNKIQDIGLKYGIVTEHTSLLVLTELRQFLKYKVIPPKQLKEIRKEYLNEIQSEIETEETRQKNKIEQVLKKWEEKRIKWHKRDFMKELLEEKKKKEEQEQESFGTNKITGKYITLCEGFINPLRERQPGGKDNTRHTLRKQVVNLTRYPPGVESSDKLSCQCVLIGSRGLKSILSIKKRFNINLMAIFEDELIVRYSSHCHGINGKLYLRFNLIVDNDDDDENNKTNIIDSIESQGFMTITRRGIEKQRGRRIRNIQPMMSMSSSPFSIDSFEESFNQNQFQMNNTNGMLWDSTFGNNNFHQTTTTTKPNNNNVDQVDSSSLSSSSSENIIRVKSFDSGEKYMELIKKSKKPYEKYMELKKEKYNNSPSFYLDVADFFLTIKTKNNKKKQENQEEEEEEEEGENNNNNNNEEDSQQQQKIIMSNNSNKLIGIRILSNICELELNNVQLNRIVGYRLDQSNMLDEAKYIFEKILSVQLIHNQEPQSYRDLALVLEKMGKFEKSAEYLWKVITMNIDNRFDEIELTAAVELNHVLFKMFQNNNDSQVLKKLGIDKRFLYSIDCDIRISMGWDSDMTDIDLHVYDPNNEHCYYSNKETTTGGFISRDFTKGYGPEEFMQRVAVKGKYKISAKYFASHRQDLCGGTTILLNIYTNYLREGEKREMITLRLNKNKEEVEVCEMEFFK